MATHKKLPEISVAEKLADSAAAVASGSMVVIALVDTKRQSATLEVAHHQVLRAIDQWPNDVTAAQR